MLVLSCPYGRCVYVGDVKILVQRQRGRQVRLGFITPAGQTVCIERDSVRERKKATRARG